MAGFLTDMFDDGSSTETTNAQSLGVEEAFDVEQSFTVSHSESFGFEDMNGTQHSYSNSQDVTLDVSVHALVGVAAETTQGVATGDGFEE